MYGVNDLDFLNFLQICNFSYLFLKSGFQQTSSTPWHMLNPPPPKYNGIKIYAIFHFIRRKYTQ